MILSKIFRFIFGRSRDDYGPSGWGADSSSTDGSSSGNNMAKSDIDTLCKTVASGEYIANLRIGRSWILPQMLEMGGVRRGHLHFDIDKYEKAVRSLSYTYSHFLMIRILRAMKRVLVGGRRMWSG